jgi:GT2 family glycosyltransferase
MHADNIAKPGWLKTLLGRLREAGPSVGSICTSWDDFDSSGVVRMGENEIPPMPKLILADRESVAGTIEKGCWWHISSCATRVRAYRDIGGLPPGFRLKGDWDFLLRMLGSGWDVEYIPASLMLYRMNPAGSSSVSFRRHRDIVETVEIARRHWQVLDPGQVFKFHVRQLRTLARRIGGGLLKGQWNRAFGGLAVCLYVIRSWWRFRFEPRLIGRAQDS